MSENPTLFSSSDSDNAVNVYAAAVWGKTALTGNERVFMAHSIRRLNSEDIESLPNSYREMVKSTKEIVEKSPSFQQEPPTPDTLMVVEKSKLLKLANCKKLKDSKIADLLIRLHESWSAWEVDLKPAPSVVGAGFGLISGIAKLTKYYKTKREVGLLQQKLVALEEMSKNAEPQQKKALQTEILDLTTEIQEKKMEMEQYKKARISGALGFAALPYIMGYVHNAAHIIQAITPLLVSAGGIVFGAILAPVSIYQMVQEKRRTNRVNDELRHLATRSASEVKPQVALLTQLRKDNIANHAKKNTIANYFQHMMTSASGIAAIVIGGLILGGIASTGVGLIVIGVMGVLACIAVAGYKLYKINQGRMKEVVTMQKEIQTTQNQINDHIKDNKLDVVTLTKLQSQLLTKKNEYKNLKIKHKIEYQTSASKDSIDSLFRAIDAMGSKTSGSEELEMADIQELTGLDLSFFKEGGYSESDKMKVKMMLAEWITNPEANPIMQE